MSEPSYNSPNPCLVQEQRASKRTSRRLLAIDWQNPATCNPSDDLRWACCESATVETHLAPARHFFLLQPLWSMSFQQPHPLFISGSFLSSHFSNRFLAISTWYFNSQRCFLPPQGRKITSFSPHLFLSRELNISFGLYSRESAGKLTGRPNEGQTDFSPAYFCYAIVTKGTKSMFMGLPLPVKSFYLCL